MDKPNGHIVLTKADFAERTRRNRKATVGELEAGYNQMAADMERFATVFEARVAALEKAAGIGPGSTQSDGEAVSESEHVGIPPAIVPQLGGDVE